MASAIHTEHNPVEALQSTGSVVRALEFAAAAAAAAAWSARTVLLVLTGKADLALSFHQLHACLKANDNEHR